MALLTAAALLPADPCVRPADVRYLMGVGDSMTIGWAQLGRPLEYRGRSFSAGGDPGVMTLPNLFRDLGNATVGGASLGTKPMGAGVCTGPQADAVCRLNAAVEGAAVGDVHSQLDYLESRMASLPQGEGEYKLLTLFVGLADAVFGGDPTPADRFRRCYASVLARLATWPRLVVNAVLLPPKIDAVARIVPRYPICRAADAIDHSRIANFSWTRAEEWAPAIRAYNQAILGAVADVTRDRAGRVAARRSLVDLVPTDALVEKVDCFHPNAALSAAMAINLWNDMLAPEKAAFDLHASPLVPRADACIRSSG